MTDHQTMRGMPCDGSPGTSVRDQEIAAEQRHVDRVYARLDELRDSAAAAVEAGYLVADIGTVGALVERDALVHRASRRLRELDSQHEGLVFGRLDPVDGGPRWIGRLGVLDEAYDPLVVDWRAPVAAPFYQATTADPQGVRRRRVIRTAGPAVVDVEDDLLVGDEQAGDLRVVGDGALMAALTRARGPAMRDIVATIQQEQDLAVRAPSTGVTTISGGPGTGKTAVATHRAAYLLYRDRKRFQGAGVLLVGPSPVFMSYIERVLPSLGESSATLRDLGSLLDGVTAARVDDREVAAVKGSLAMRTFLARAAADAPPGAPEDLRVTFGGEVLRLSAQQLAGVRRTVARRRRPINQLRGGAQERLVAALWARRPPDVDWEHEQFAEQVPERPAFVALLARWWPPLRPADVLAWCAEPARAAGYARGVLSDTAVDLLLRSWAGTREPSVQDVPLLDELRVLLGPVAAPQPAVEVADGEVTAELSTVAERQLGARPAYVRPDDYDGYAHVVVDESQDMSPMQWRMLGRRGPYASWTVVGDPAQSAWGDPAEAAAARDEALSSRARHTYALTTNYRNPREIFDLAAAVLRRVDPDAPVPTAVRSTGIRPRHLLVPPDELLGRLRTATEQLLAEVEGTVGVLCAPGLTDEVRAAVVDLVPERLTVLDAMQSKGMEYDGVLAVQPDGIADGSVAGWRTLYVVLSRSTQRLTTIGTTQVWLPS